MDQLKDILKQAVKYRFWIAVGIASLLPLIAFFVGTGAIAEEEKTQTGKIKAAKNDAGSFASGPIQNSQWKAVVDEKKALLAQDVVKSHIKLYDRQAPLLTWPKAVAEEIETWGETYPQGIDVQRINDKILDYTQVYNEYVDEVYKTFQPFDLKTGEGIVAAPSKYALLRPVEFTETVRPSLSDIWAAQRKLWIERTMFDVIAKVNKKAKAKTWDDAPIKQIVMLEVANDLALDQKTAAKPDDLIDAPPITGDPLATATPKAESTGSGGRSADAAGFGAAAASGPSGPETIKFVKSPNPDQYYVVPVAMTVYIEQDRIPDLLVEFRNSPMSIRVLDFQMRRPSTPVKKPQKGEESAAFGGMMTEGRGKGGTGGGLAGDSGAGGGAQALSLESMNAGSNAYNNRMKGQTRTMGGGVGTTAKAQPRESGKDLKAANIEKRKKQKGDADKDDDKTKDDKDAAPVLSNPYFNVVQVTIRGQARFYKAPVRPATPESSASPGNAAPETPKPDAAKAEAVATDAAKAEAAKAEAVATDAAKPDAAKPDAAKPDAAKPDAPKADATKPEPATGDVPKADAAKPEPPKGEAPKVDATKNDAPKPETPKSETPKPEAPKPDAPAPKADGEKPKP